MQADLQESVDEIARLLGASATLEDRAFQLLAYAAQSGDIDVVRRESILRRRASDEVRAYFEGYGIAAAPGPVRIPADAELGVLARVCVPLRHGGVTYGYLWLLDDGAITDALLAGVAPLVGRAAATLAQEARSRQDLGGRLRELFSADPERRAGALARLDLPGPVTAVAVRAAEGRVAALWTLPRGVLAQPGDPAALLTPGHAAAETAARVAAMYGTAAGLGGPREDPGEAWRSWREALWALRVAERVPRFAPVASWRELGVYRLLSRLPAEELRELTGEAAGLLADPELARTVETYLDRGGHAQETAAELGVHRQTLYYRLAKAERLAAADLADGEARLRLHLALKAAHLSA
ncbi:transcriptional regulator [Microtetraspora sp. NBRC 13810]|uniref:PucR family transcriptional regulator n=1 Tax=Microtetraspora sp. NBRC 13810 TaxID=3030990 RepID=UPI0024A2CE0E|nr:helix-turn-helix domain-containing protein [Microtetraspora sp. NBRC 13810]GLW06753.1 transcriptional regulator [Microtetraspora sp. NBRC 13810]